MPTIVKPTPKEKEFWEVLGTIRESWAGGPRSILAYHLGLWYGEKGRERALNDVDGDELARIEFAFELGLQIRPVWQEVDKAVRSALISAAVALILGALGVK